MMSWLSIALGGFLGANCRFLIGRWAKKYFQSNFPVGTFIVNIIGSFLLGLTFALSVGDLTYFLIGVGFFGAFTTFSTLNVETVELLLNDHKKVSFIYIGFTYSLGITVALIGYYLGS